MSNLPVIDTTHGKNLLCRVDNGIWYCRWCNRPSEDGCEDGCYGLFFLNLEFVVNLEQANCKRGCCGTSTSTGTGDTLEEAVAEAVECLPEPATNPTCDVSLRCNGTSQNIKPLIKAAADAKAKREADQRAIEHREEQNSRYLREFTRIIGVYNQTLYDLNQAKDDYTCAGFEKQLKELEEDKESELKKIAEIYPLAVPAIDSVI